MIRVFSLEQFYDTCRIGSAFQLSGDQVLELPSTIDICLRGCDSDSWDYYCLNVFESLCGETGKGLLRHAGSGSNRYLTGLSVDGNHRPGGPRLRAQGSEQQKCNEGFLHRFDAFGTDLKRRANITCGKLKFQPCGASSLLAALPPHEVEGEQDVVPQADCLYDAIKTACKPQSNCLYASKQAACSTIRSP